MLYVVRRYNQGDSFSYAVFDYTKLNQTGMASVVTVPINCGVHPIISGLTKDQANRRAEKLLK